MTALPRRTTEQIPVAKLLPNPDQHRRHFDQAALEELAASLRARGVLQNLVVRRHPKRRGMFEIIAGERRFRAARIAGLQRVPCRIIRADDAEAYRLSLVENVQRAEVSALEEADGYTKLRDAFGMTAAAIAEAVGKSDQYVNHKLLLATVSKGVRRLIEAGLLSPLHAYFIARLPEAEDQTRLATIAVQRQLTQLELNRMVNLVLDGTRPGEPQGPMFDVPALNPEEQARRTRFQETLERVTKLLWSSWDQKLQKINEKVVRSAVETDLQRVRNLRQWLGDVEIALNTEIQRRNLGDALSAVRP